MSTLTTADDVLAEAVTSLREEMRAGVCRTIDHINGHRVDGEDPSECPATWGLQGQLAGISYALHLLGQCEDPRECTTLDSQFRLLTQLGITRTGEWAPGRAPITRAAVASLLGSAAAALADDAALAEVFALLNDAPDSDAPTDGAS